MLRLDSLTDDEAELIHEVMTRRRPSVVERFRRDDVVSRSDAEEIVNALGEELSDNLDENWEPTEYGRTVSAVLAQVNALRIRELP